MSAEGDTDSAPPQGEPSKIPSWILLGFVLGALFVLLFKLKTPPPADASSAVNNPALPATPTPTPSSEPSQAEKSKADPPLTTLEAVWAIYGDYAVWEGDITQVALWNPETQTFRDCFEVVRRGDHVFFRSIPALTRPVSDRGLGPAALLRFTVPGPTGRQR